MNIKFIKNWLLDQKKEKFNPFERSQAIQDYLTVSGLSCRQLAMELKMPKSTLQDWLMWKDITEKQYKDLKFKGFKDTEIYRMLRSKNELDKSLNTIRTDLTLMQVITHLEKAGIRFEKTNNTAELVSDIKKKLNRVEFLLKKESDET